MFRDNAVLNSLYNTQFIRNLAYYDSSVCKNQFIQIFSILIRCFSSWLSLPVSFFNIRAPSLQQLVSLCVKLRCYHTFPANGDDSS